MPGRLPLNPPVFETAMVNPDVGVHGGQRFVDDVGGKLAEFKHLLRAGLPVVKDSCFLPQTVRQHLAGGEQNMRVVIAVVALASGGVNRDRKSTRLNSSH